MLRPTYRYWLMHTRCTDNVKIRRQSEIATNANTLIGENSFKQNATDNVKCLRTIVTDIYLCIYADRHYLFYAAV